MDIIIEIEQEKDGSLTLKYNPHFYRVVADSFYTSASSAASLIHVGVRAPQATGLPLAGNPA